MNLTDSEVANYLRNKAKKLLATADMLDGVAPVSTANGEVTVEKVVEAMNGRSKRVGDIAAELKVSRQGVEDVMTEENGFILQSQGWFSHKSH